MGDEGKPSMSLRRRLGILGLSLIVAALIPIVKLDLRHLQSTQQLEQWHYGDTLPKRLEIAPQSEQQQQHSGILAINNDLITDKSIEAPRPPDGETYAFLHAENAAPRRSHTALETGGNDTRPDLNDLIVNDTIVGDVQFLLDFAIIGFGKCGTSTLMHWLAGHEEIRSFRDELWELMRSRPDNLVRMLYEQLPEGQFKRGYKSPAEVTQDHILEYFRNLFPKTKLFIGVRHPIRWFESLYNFRVQNLKEDETIVGPNKMIGKCARGMKQCCTEKGNFAYNLLKLGKHLIGKPNYQMTKLDEGIVNHFKRGRFNTSTIPITHNPVFFFDIRQVADDNVTRQNQFRRDVQSFLGLEAPLPALGHHKPGRRWDSEIQMAKDRMKIQICDPEYVPVRRELLRLSRLNSKWLKTVFIASPTVHVSSRAYLETVLDEWMHDPCSNETDIIRYHGPKLSFPQT